MEVITKKKLLQKAKEYLSDELNRVQDELNKLNRGKELVIPNSTIHTIEQELNDVSAVTIAKILAYGLIQNPVKPTIIGVKFDAEEVIVHYKEN